MIPEWRTISVLGSVAMRPGCELRAVHVQHGVHRGESVELRVTYNSRDGAPRENYVRIDRAAIPALIRMLEKL